VKLAMVDVLLPEHIEPMLARIGTPFDDPQHLFELKWDGVRAITYVEGGRHRMHGRRRRDLAQRYPELQFLAGLQPGLVLDGELVVLRSDGRPDFRAVIGRENASATRAEAAARRHPVVYIVFDLLYRDGEPLLQLPLHERRRQLEQVVSAAGNARLVLSQGVVGAGLSLFAAVRERGLEGIVGKRLDSTYRPGERSLAWQKMKPVQSMHCVILGYEPDGDSDFKSLIIGTDVDGELRCVGRVGSGLTDANKQELRKLLFARRAPRPLVDTDVAGVGKSGVWVEPGLFCTVNFLEWTENGALRAPVFLGLVPGGGE
jgi:DNA ligase D-like protein (predicted ligase)